MTIKIYLKICGRPSKFADQNLRWPGSKRRRADDGEAEQTRRARRGREQDVAEISRRMYEEIRSSRDPRDHVEDG